MEVLSQFQGALVTRSVLDNGLTVITADLGSEAEFVVANYVFRAGSVEDGDAHGAAHFLEHLMCRGGAADGEHPAIAPFLQRGAEFNGQTNAWSTRYYLDGYRQELREIIHALHEVVFQPVITPLAVEREKGPILGEIAKDEVEDCFPNWYRSNLYPDASFFHHPVLGSNETVGEMTEEMLLQQHAQYYHPGNAALIVAGGARHQEVLEMLARLTFPRVGKRSRVRGDLEASPGIYTYRGQERGTALELQWRFKGDERDQYVFQVATDLLTGGMRSLAYQRLRIQEKIVYAVNAEVSLHPMARFSVGAALSRENMKRVERAFPEVVRDLRVGKVDMELWARVKNTAYREIHFRNVALKEQTSLYRWRDDLDNYWVYDAWPSIDVEKLLADVTLEDVMEAVQRCIDLEDVRVIRTNP